MTSRFVSATLTRSPPNVHCHCDAPSQTTLTISHLFWTLGSNNELVLTTGGQTERHPVASNGNCDGSAPSTPAPPSGGSAPSTPATPSGSPVTDFGDCTKNSISDHVSHAAAQTLH